MTRLLTMHFTVSHGQAHSLGPMRLWGSSPTQSRRRGIVTRLLSLRRPIMPSKRQIDLYLDTALCNRFIQHLGQGWSLRDVLERFVSDAMAQAVEAADLDNRMVLTPDEMRKMHRG